MTTSEGRPAAPGRGRVPAMIFAAIMLGGCQSSPQAPLLSDAPVYQNQQEGFSFLVPEGWTQTNSAVLPAGEIDGEIFLVRYRMKSAEQGATLQVICFQERAPTDLAIHQAGASFGVSSWSLVKEDRHWEVNGAQAEHYVYQATLGDQAITKDVICFRHAGRVYAFVGLYLPADDFARQQLNRAVGSVLWAA